MLQVSTNSLEGWYDRAVELHRAGRVVEAEQIYRQILSVLPQHAGALRRAGVAAAQQGRVAEGIGLLERAAAIVPKDPETLSDLGNALQEAARFEDALPVCRAAVEYGGEYAETWTNLGHVLGKCADLRGGIAALERALAIRPDLMQAINNMGAFLRELGKVDEAIAYHERGLGVHPQHLYNRINLGNALKDAGRLGEAIARYREASDLALAQGHKQRAAEAETNAVYTMLFDSAYSAEEIYEAHKQWAARHAAGLKQMAGPWAGRTDGRRLRIGYVSPDFREHVVGRNLLPLFRHHDRSRFEIFCYADLLREDAFSAAFRAHCDHWVPIAGMSDEAVAQRIAADGVDILVDLALHLARGRMLVMARKPAPIQATFAGYPGTTGLEAIDWRLTDPFLDPPEMGEKRGMWYAERSVRLPASFWCYEALPLGGEAPAVSVLPALANGFVTFGCLNNFCKVSEESLGMWRRVMEGVAGSRLILLCPEGSARKRVLERLGVGAERVEFVWQQAREEYLRTYERIDVCLDTVPYNGHTTSLDAMWMGVPVVSVVGRTVVGRAGWSQMKNVEMGELVAVDGEGFVKTAISLAQDLDKLAQMRRGMRERVERSVLMDGVGFARGVEEAYERMEKDGPF